MELDSAGNAVAPNRPGIGMDVDWDSVDDSTHTHLNLTGIGTAS
jgi:hypothetical protein